jgi:carbon-monoxide dehydrogenase small subunit
MGTSEQGATRVVSHVRLRVNGQAHVLTVGGPKPEVDVTDTLAHTLRETLGLTGTKVSCDHGACGCCTVLVDGDAMLSCMMLTVECDGRSIVTVEGLADPETGALDPLQQSFIDHTAFQCGYCTPGILMSAKALLDSNPQPSPDDVREALSGNFCRCITHYHVLEAVNAVIKDSPGGAAAHPTAAVGANAGAPVAVTEKPGPPW